MKLEGENVLVRFFVDTSRQWHRRPLYEALVELAHTHHLAGATVLEGVEGFGQRGHVLKESHWHVTNAREMIVEIIDTRHKAEAFLEIVEPMLGDTVVTLERAHVIHYRTKGTEP
jgi:uncharacterized protein